MLVLRSTPELTLALWVKSAIDLIGAAILLVASFFLIWWWVAILIKIGSPKGPIFFRQKRAGRYGEAVHDVEIPDHASGRRVEARRDQGGAGQRDERAGLQVGERSPHLRIRQFLRRSSIDELPQLLNVLRGDMSLVGPRPLPLYEVEQFAKSEHRRRLSVKPGLTCTWQAQAATRITSFEEWVRLDLEYIDNWSLWLDIKILLKTVPAVLFRWDRSRGIGDWELGIGNGGGSGCLGRSPPRGLRARPEVVGAPGPGPRFECPGVAKRNGSVTHSGAR